MKTKINSRVVNDENVCNRDCEHYCASQHYCTELTSRRGAAFPEHGTLCLPAILSERENLKQRVATLEFNYEKTLSFIRDLVDDYEGADVFEYAGINRDDQEV